jgi:hypothetical protein
MRGLGFEFLVLRDVMVVNAVIAALLAVIGSVGYVLYRGLGAIFGF